jgi:hypothetical protein
MQYSLLNYKWKKIHLIYYWVYEDYDETSYFIYFCETFYFFIRFSFLSDALSGTIRKILLSLRKISLKYRSRLAGFTSGLILSGLIPTNTLAALVEVLESS